MRNHQKVFSQPFTSIMVVAYFNCICRAVIRCSTILPPFYQVHICTLSLSVRFCFHDDLCESLYLKSTLDSGVIVITNLCYIVVYISCCDLIPSVACSNMSNNELLFEWLISLLNVDSSLDRYRCALATMTWKLQFLVLT